MHRPGLLPGACDMGNPCSQHLAGCSWPATECRGCLCKMGWGADSSDGDSSLKAFHQPGGNVLEPVGSAKVAYPAPPSPFPRIIPSSCHLLLDILVCLKKPSHKPSTKANLKSCFSHVCVLSKSLDLLHHQICCNCLSGAYP